jgi:hypothetical protein
VWGTVEQSVGADEVRAGSGIAASPRPSPLNAVLGRPSRGTGVRRYIGMRPTRRALVLLAPALGACGISDDEALPEVHQAMAFDAPAPCNAPPPPPAELVEHPGQPQRCLPPLWDHRVLPVEVIVDGGRVADIRFYDQCSGESFVVDPMTAACIRWELATWRYLTWDGCPAESSRTVDRLLLRRLGHVSTLVASQGMERGCAG